VLSLLQNLRETERENPLISPKIIEMSDLIKKRQREFSTLLSVDTHGENLEAIPHDPLPTNHQRSQGLLCRSANRRVARSVAGVWVMEGYIFAAWLLSIAAGGVIGAFRNCTALGLVVCLFLGPLGIPVAMVLDERTQGPQCNSKLNGHPNQCPQCWARFRWNAKKTKCEYIAFEFRQQKPAPDDKQ